jgi:hypothetical protein
MTEKSNTYVEKAAVLKKNNEDVTAMYDCWHRTKNSAAV